MLSCCMKADNSGTRKAPPDVVEAHLPADDGANLPAAGADAACGVTTGQVFCGCVGSGAMRDGLVGDRPRGE